MWGKKTATAQLQTPPKPKPTASPTGLFMYFKAWAGCLCFRLYHYGMPQAKIWAKAHLNNISKGGQTGWVSHGLWAQQSSVEIGAITEMDYVTSGIWQQQQALHSTWKEHSMVGGIINISTISGVGRDWRQHWMMNCARKLVPKSTTTWDCCSEKLTVGGSPDGWVSESEKSIIGQSVPKGIKIKNVC